MSDLDKTQQAPNPALAKTVRIDPGAAPAAPAPEDPMRRTVVLQAAPTIDAVAWMVGERGEERGRTHQINGERVIIGADQTCDVPISDQHASDRHASIRFSEGQFTIADLDSTNGTRVNGESVLRQSLQDGDRISIGSSDWVFKCVVFNGESA